MYPNNLPNQMPTPMPPQHYASGQQANYQPLNQQQSYFQQSYHQNQMPQQQPYQNNRDNIQQPYGQSGSNYPNQMQQQQPYGQHGNLANQIQPKQLYGQPSNYSNQMTQQQTYGQPSNNPNSMALQQPYGQPSSYQIQQQPYGHSNNYQLSNGNQQAFGMPSYNQSRNVEMPVQASQSAQPMQVFQKYEISPQMAQKLQALQSFKIVFIFDDSGSMNSTDTGTMTRWEELLQFANASIEIASVFNQNGSDVHFLNRPAMRNVRDSNQLAQCFRDRPQGVTPLTRAIQTVVNENSPQTLVGKNLLLIIATDGEPTDPYGNPNIPEFKQSLYNRPGNTFTTIVACTNDLNSIGYLNGLDKELPRLDVCDDYRSEFAEVKRSRGPQFSFSYGDYIAKAFIGSIDSDLDRWDE